MLLLAPCAGSSAPVTHCTLPRSRPWRVAFVGDSITRGNTTFGRQPPLEDGPAQWSSAVGCWPCELAARARADGIELEQHNLGVWGVPVLSRAHTSQGVHSSPPLGELLDGRLARSVSSALAEADVLFVMLGTNDAKSAAADVRAHFETDLRALLDRLFAMRRRTSRPGACAWLLLPPMVHGGAGSAPVFGIQPELVRALAPRVRAVAAALGIGVIDVRAPLESDWRAAFGRGAAGTGLMGDGVHPPPLGMRLIAHAVWQKLAAHSRAPRRPRAPHRSATRSPREHSLSPHYQPNPNPNPNPNPSPSPSPSPSPNPNPNPNPNPPSTTGAPRGARGGTRRASAAAAPQRPGGASEAYPNGRERHRIQPFLDELKRIANAGGLNALNGSRCNLKCSRDSSPPHTVTVRAELGEQELMSVALMSS